MTGAGEVIALYADRRGIAGQLQIRRPPQWKAA